MESNHESSKTLGCLVMPIHPLSASWIPLSPSRVTLQTLPLPQFPPCATTIDLLELPEIQKPGDFSVLSSYQYKAIQLTLRILLRSEERGVFGFILIIILVLNSTWTPQVPPH
ncbi:Hypothetical predicted protein [Olea europaea subsp. europaea]|uniref:Uncharacterized protein n=1 Tax=Olea europaea subsp. europaea TaxID=158383 RepID=A0A8S0QRL9_OLEEU|nr:Hypothetical predicted protein [Olea europaea subsp. europaea]